LSSTVTVPKSDIDPTARRRAVLMVAFATFLGAAAQILMKMGTEHALHNPGLLGILTNPPLIAGYSLYGVMTVMIVVAYKDGELSVLYPVISLSYVWVTALSYFIFHDTLNAYKLIGLATIICGVAVIGRGAKA
jgi:multidrug transporter EmrE-like cation transporter